MDSYPVSEQSERNRTPFLSLYIYYIMIFIKNTIVNNVPIIERLKCIKKSPLNDKRGFYLIYIRGSFSKLSKYFTISSCS